MSIPRNSLFLLIVLSCIWIPEACRPGQMAIHGGSVKSSTAFQPTHQYVNTDALKGQPFIEISKDNIELDFRGSTLDGRQEGRMPDAFSGVAIYIRDCKNVTIKNIRIHGFKIAILAENVENLQILSSDVSYNYRPSLRSRWDREALSDWLYYHHNEHDEWKEYGAAIYLKQCLSPVISDIRCHQGFNGLLMVQCQGGTIWNNDICFNSGLGIGMYRSSHNRIMHNHLDWNARGYSHGQYARGQDSSAILLYEQSSHNIIAFNSGTHSGDGLFLWAGQSTMDSGTGGCDSNLICNNDFSHSIANGIEATFSANYMADNILHDCRYGVWGGYSHHTVIRGNSIHGCETSIAIEHGRYNVIEGNTLSGCKAGIELWSRSSQPEDWPYAQKINVAGRGYLISKNHFEHLNSSLEISLTDSVWIDRNTWSDAPRDYTSPKGSSTILPGRPEATWANPDFKWADPIPGGKNTRLPAETLQGRKYIIINEWGPYDFKYPLLALRDVKHTEVEDELNFDILGPHGSWTIDTVAGCLFPEIRSGTIPDSLIIRCPKNSYHRNIACSFTGDQVITQMGDTIPHGIRSPFGYVENNWPLHWDIAFFNYDSLSDPLEHPAAFQKLLGGVPTASMTQSRLAFRWWNAPMDRISADRFAVLAISSLDVPAGEYVLDVESDDGIRVWLDDALVLDHWDVHTPAIDEQQISIAFGKHTLRVEYFEGGGLGVLDVSVR